MPPRDKKDDKPNRIQACVEKELRAYFKMLDGQPPCELHKMVVSEAEKALFRMVLKHADGNQSRCAEYLGISRGTLRKKLVEYELN